MTQTHFETHPLVGTAGIPLVVYPGLKLNFLRPKFLRVISEFVSGLLSALSISSLPDPRLVCRLEPGRYSYR